MRLFVVVLLLSLAVTAVTAGKGKKSKGKKNKTKRRRLSNSEYEYFEGATDEALIMNDPVALNARRMSQLLKRQDVVATCRYLLFKAYKDFNGAKDACHNVDWPFTHKGIELASVNSEEENKEIRILLQLAYGIKQVGSRYNRDNWVWVGLEKIQNNNFTLATNMRGPTNFDTNEWQWLDGTHPKFSKWMRDMPDQEFSRRFRDYQNHVMINKRGFWDDTFPEIEAPYACNYCGKYIVVQEFVTWHHAKHLCESYGLMMAKVNSKQDNIELGWAANLTFGPETAERRWNDTNWIWLGTEEVVDENGAGTGEWIHYDGDELGWSQSGTENDSLITGRQTEASRKR